MLRPDTHSAVQHPSEEAGWEPSSPAPHQPKRPAYLLHIGLFIATLTSTFYVGGSMTTVGFDPIIGLGYMVSIMAILTAHEMGHYVVSRMHGVKASLPYFVPFPSIPGLIWSPFGTMGAVIIMRSKMPDRRALLDIAAAGPITGFTVTLFVAVIGLSLSTVVSYENLAMTPGIVLGDPLLLNFLEYLILGPTPDGAVLMLHPVAYAAWAGLFVTALNLIPFGQLDGGHILYALWPHRHKIVARVVTAALIILAIKVSSIWTLWAIIGVAFGSKHPAPLVNYIPLDKRRRLIACLCGAILLLTFMFNPISVPSLSSP